MNLDRVVEPLDVPRTQQQELRALWGLRHGARAVMTLEASNVEDTEELVTTRDQLAGDYAR